MGHNIFRVFWRIFRCLYRGRLWILHSLHPPRAELLDQEESAQHPVHHFWGNEEWPSLSDQEDSRVPGQDPDRGAGGEAGWPSVLQEYEEQQSCQQGRVLAELPGAKVRRALILRLIMRLMTCYFQWRARNGEKGELYAKRRDRGLEIKTQWWTGENNSSGVCLVSGLLKWIWNRWCFFSTRLRESLHGSRDSFKEQTSNSLMSSKQKRKKCLHVRFNTLMSSLVSNIWKWNKTQPSLEFSLDLPRLNFIINDKCSLEKMARFTRWL